MMVMRRIHAISGSIWRALVAAYPLLLVAAAWEAAARLGYVRPVFLPPLSTVIAQFMPLAQAGDLLEPLLISLYRTAVGLAIAIVVGVVVGFLMARVRFVRWLLDPLIAFSFPSPKVAFLPVFILWFGIDHLSKIALVAFTCVFPFIVAAYAGAMTVPTNQLWAARAMGTGKLGLLWRVILPASLPSIVTGAAVGMGITWEVVVAAELISGGGQDAADGGLGFLVWSSYQGGDLARVVVGMISLGVAGYLSSGAVRLAGARLMPWRRVA